MSFGDKPHWTSGTSFGDRSHWSKGTSFGDRSHWNRGTSFIGTGLTEPAGRHLVTGFTDPTGRHVGTGITARTGRHLGTGLTDPKSLTHSKKKKQQVRLAVLRTFHCEILAGTAFSLRFCAFFLSNSGQMSAQLPYAPSKYLSTHHSPITTPCIFSHKSALLFKLFLCICAIDVQ